MICDRRTNWLVSFGFLALVASPAHAQPVATSCEAVPECLARFGVVQRLSKSKDYPHALQILSDLHQQYGDPKLLYSIGLTLSRLGRHAEAVTAYRDYLASGVEKDAAQIAKVQEELRKAKELAQPAPAVAAPQPPAATVPGAAQQPVSEAKPLYKKPWFWAVLGGGVAAIGLGVGLGVGLSSRGPSLPEGVNTYVATF